MYSDVMDTVRSLLEQSNEESSTVFVATIAPNGSTANATFLGNEEQMVKLFVSLIKLADERLDGKILKESVLEAFSKGVVNIELSMRSSYFLVSIKKIMTLSEIEKRY